MLNDGKSSEDFYIDIVSTKLSSQSEYLEQAKQAEDWRNVSIKKYKNINAKEKEKNKERKAYQKSLRISKTRNDLIDEITDQGYIVTHDPLSDGNCQFLTLSDSLEFCDPHKHSGKRL